MPRGTGRRDNFGRFQKEATIHLKKQLLEVAEKTGTNIRKDVKEKLEDVYITNLRMSYGPRSMTDIPYIHQNILEEAIEVNIKDDTTIKVEIKDEKTYDNGRTPSEVYTYLTKGTKGGGEYTFIDEDTGKQKLAYNYPTPIHPFEEQTKAQMMGYLDSLKTDICNGKYSK